MMAFRPAQVARTGALVRSAGADDESKALGGATRSKLAASRPNDTERSSLQRPS